MKELWANISKLYRRPEEYWGILFSLKAMLSSWLLTSLTHTMVVIVCSLSSWKHQHSKGLSSVLDHQYQRKIGCSSPWACIYFQICSEKRATFVNGKTVYCNPEDLAEFLLPQCRHWKYQDTSCERLYSTKSSQSSRIWRTICCRKCTFESNRI